MGGNPPPLERACNLEKCSNSPRPEGTSTVTSSRPSPASAVRRAGRRGSFRAGSVLLLIFFTSLGTLLGVSPAYANSASGIAANSWIVSDLASTAINTASTMPYDPVLEAEMVAAAGATTTTTAKPGTTAKPKAGGKLGLIINTAAVLGGFIIGWPGGEEAPELPAPSGQTGPVGPTHGDGCGWATAGIVITHTADCVADQILANWLNAPGYSSGQPVDFEWDLQPGKSALMTTDYSRYFPGNNFDFDRVYTLWVGGVGTGTKIGQIILPAYGQAGSGTNPYPDVETDPALVPRYIDSTATCKQPDGMGGYTTSIITDRVGPFTFDPSSPSELPEVPDLTCPAGSFLSAGTRELATEGSTETVPLAEPYTAPEWVEEQATRFPECMPIGGQACQLKLFRKSTAADPELDCHSVAPGSGNACRDWATDPDKATKYECRYGGNVVALKQCEPYKSTFKTGTIAPTPETETPTPTTGADPTPDATPNLGDCVPSWSTELLNPWWLFKGAACALSWAFVPQTDLVPRVDGIKAEMLTKAPFSWFAGFASIPVAIPDTGCPDWRVKVGTLDENVVCGHSSTEFIRAARPVLLIFMASLALWPLIRSTAYAAFPIIKPQPGMLR